MRRFIREAEEPPLLRFREGAVPENVRRLGRQQRALQESLQLVFEADLVVGDGQERGAGQSRLSQRSGHLASDLAVAIGLVRQITAEQLIGAFAAQYDGHILAGSLGEEPGRKAPASALGSSE